MGGKNTLTKEEKIAIHFEKVIDRELYRRIKRMDRQQINDMFRYIYSQGWNDAAAEKGGAPDLERLRTELSEVKGIGEKRLGDIMKIIGDIYTG